MGHLADVFSYNDQGQIVKANESFFIDGVDNNTYRLNILEVIRHYLARSDIDESTREAGSRALGVLQHRAETQTFLARKRIIKVMPEAGCYPLWVRTDEGIFSSEDPKDLLKGADLIKDINEWDERYQPMIMDCENYDFTADFWKTHDQEGRELAVRVARELPDDLVYWAGEGEDHLVKH